MKLYCGSIDDVYAYEKMRWPGSGSAQPPTSVAKLGGAKKVSFKEKAAWAVACEPYHEDSGRDQRQLHHVGAPAEVLIQTSSSGQTAAKKKMKEPPSRKVGLVEILLGYNSLLQLSLSPPVMARQRKQLYPTIGFVQNPRNYSE